MNLKTALTACALGVGLFLLGRVSAEDEMEGGGGEMPAWTVLGPEHEELAKSAGDWDVAGKMWMTPGAEPMEFAATAKREMVLNGRYMREIFKAQFGPDPFEGWLLQGYDTFRKEWVHIWMDCSNPVLSISRGQVKEGVCTMTGDDPDMMTGKIAQVRTVVSHDGPDKATMTMYSNADGPERMAMQMLYTRKK